MDPETLGKLLKEERIRQGLSVRALATLADTTSPTVKRAEDGISYDWIYGKIAKALNYDLAAQAPLEDVR